MVPGGLDESLEELTIETIKTILIRSLLGSAKILEIWGDLLSFPVKSYPLELVWKTCQV